VLMLPNAGDELQGIKRGIMELADALVINKADGESENLAKQTQGYYKSALKLMKHTSFWQPQVNTCSALKNHGIEDVWAMINDYYQKSRENDYFENNRAQQNSQWLNKLIQEMLELRLKQNQAVKSQLPKLQQAVQDHEITPYNAAQKIIDLL